ncbi:hypothetical protein [Arthrobacter sp. B3I4]|uniref:hypothetical protein n=1 Tax=Arthrobacter sp. B3I4 TaxID=3042267 RepID=UPI0027D7EA1E|nr:hypothetical protein [Arthrobacter sp. B3I4]
MAAAAVAEAADGADDVEADGVDDVGVVAFAGSTLPAREAELHPVSDKAPSVTVTAIFLSK